ncbi:hypothetical protein [Pendulispora albinea]|uniref:Outer membrane protein beta-barrel domain-containing protein n=1 Tax=Pendulispora albinea TaxID=2741071 RepID=A0ABZ2M8L6_9BACT
MGVGGRRSVTIALVALSSAALAGCGAGAPLLHPARALPLGEIRAAGGLSGQIAVGSAAEDLRDAREQSASRAQPQGDPGTNPSYAKGALVAAAMGPGLAPYFSGRVGIGGGGEGGITYTGRSARLDLRKAFDDGAWSYSVGAGVTVPFYGRHQGGTLSNVNLDNLRGYGADIPLLVGWESSGGIYKIWAGPRAGWEHVSIENLTSERKDGPPNTSGKALSADRFYAGAVLGLAVGFRHVHVALELSGAYNHINGQYNDNNVTVTGVALTPSSALWWTF